MELHGVPVTKGVLLATAGVSVLAQTYKNYPLGALTRALVRPWLFATPSELCMGSLLLYNFHALERQTGPAKHGSLLFLASALSQAGQFLLSSALGVKTATGPYAAIYSMLVAFIVDIPPSSRFFVGNVQLSDKVFSYGAAAVLALQSGASFASAACGIISGLLLRSNTLGLAKFMLPSGLLRLLGRTLGPLLETKRPAVHIVTPGGQTQSGGAGTSAARQATPAAPPRGGGLGTAPGGAQAAPVAVSEEALSQLVSMGFDQARASAALQETHNDVQNALALLL